MVPRSSPGVLHVSAPSPGSSGPKHFTNDLTAVELSRTTGPGGISGDLQGPGVQFWCASLGPCPPGFIPELLAGTGMKLRPVGPGGGKGYLSGRAGGVSPAPPARPPAGAGPAGPVSFSFTFNLNSFYSTSSTNKKFLFLQQS